MTQAESSAYGKCALETGLCVSGRPTIHLQKAGCISRSSSPLSLILVALEFLRMTAKIHEGEFFFLKTSL